MIIYTFHGAYHEDTIGGSEKQLEIIENSLVKKGHSIFHVQTTPHCSQYPFLEEKNNKHIYHLKTKNIFLRFFYGIYILYFLRNLIHSKPDLLYTREYHYQFWLYLYSKFNNVPLVVSMSSDSRCKPLYRHPIIWSKLFNKDKTINRLLGDLTIPYVSKIICQNSKQSALIRKYHSRQSEVIPNCHPIPDSILKKNKIPIVCWIANIRPLKRVELFIELASQFKDKKVLFICAGRCTDNVTLRYLHKANNNFPNFKYLGEISFDKSNELISRSEILINTSTHEGFPNVFIQAWMRNTVVVSLSVDPDDFLSKKN